MILNEKCNKCIFKDFAIPSGANIFCTVFDTEYEYSFATDMDAESCKHFKKRSEVEKCV